MHTMRMAATWSVLLISTAAADYLPLKEGNQWTYTMSNGMQVTTKIAGFESVGVVRCAVVETTTGWQTSREYVAVDEQGIKSYLSQAQGQEVRYDPPVVRVKLPYREGDTWEATVSQMGMAMTTSFQSAGQQQMQTPAGTFDCIKVRSSVNMGQSQPPMVSTIWYAEGIGAVHQVMQVSGQEITITLASTNVKPSLSTLTREPEEPRAAPTTQTAAEIRCPKCGVKVQPGAKFCPECGTKIEPPKPAVPTVCPKCGAKLPAGAKFCPACGEKIVATAVTLPPVQGQDPPGADGPAMEKYQSPDGKVLLYKPQGWNIAQGDMFGPGTYGVTVLEPQENASRPVHHVSAERADQGLRRAGRQLHCRPAGEVSRSPGDQYQFDARAGPHDCEPDSDGRR